jgi:hypothetical protein
MTQIELFVARVGRSPGKIAWNLVDRVVLVRQIQDRSPLEIPRLRGLSNRNERVAARYAWALNRRSTATPKRVILDQIEWSPQCPAYPR